MANYYSEACFAIEGITPEQMKHLEYFAEMDPDEHTYKPEELALFDDQDYPCPGFNIESVGPYCVFISGDGENFNLDNCANILKHIFFAEGQPDREDIIISMAFWCSKTRLDGFGGAGARISKKPTVWVNTMEIPHANTD